MSRNLGPMFALLIMGAGWGITSPLSKIAVSTGHQPLGLVFWQMLIGAVLLGAIVFVRGGRLALGRRQITLYLAIAFLGTILPNAASYRAAAHLPAGVMSIVIAMVPMFAFPIALALGQDRFSIARVVGLGLGLGGVALLVGPEASLPDRAMVAFIPLALIAPFFYGLEGNFVGKFGKRPMHFFGTLGTIMFVIGFGMVVYVLGEKIVYLYEGISAPLVADKPHFYVALTSMIIGVQMFLVGFLGELISRSSPNRNNYKIEKELG